MAQKDTPKDSNTTPSASSHHRARTNLSPPSPPRSWLSTPAPIRRLFALFPLQTHSPNPLPLSRHDDVSRSYSSSSRRPTLYIFTSPASARDGAPSYNPSCLQWQAWLRVQGIQVRTVSSNNHASPSGSLPFLIPSDLTGDGVSAVAPVSAGRLREWSREYTIKQKRRDKEEGSGRGRKGGEGNGLNDEKKAPQKVDEGKEAQEGDEEWMDELSEQADMREQAYIALVEHRIRAAWLYSLYLTSNFDSLACPLYIHPASSSPLVRASLARSLRIAARTSLHSLCPRTGSCSSPPPLSTSAQSPSSNLLPLPPSPFNLLFPSASSSAPNAEGEAERLYSSAEDAFSALSALLGEDEWFFGAKQPGMLDVSLFAYTHLLLDEELGLEGDAEARVREKEEEARGWVDTGLKRCLVEKGGNLVRHRRRLYKRYFA